MDKEYIRGLVSNSRIEKALDELTAYAAKVSDLDFTNIVAILSQKYKKGKKDSMMGIITSGEWAQINAQVSYAVLELDLPASTPSPVINPIDPSRRIKVFISYNHADSAVAQKLKVALRAADLDVIIDEEAMQAGADIRQFILQSVLDSDVTLSIVSEKSLLSGWVAMETINTFYLTNFNPNKKFIAGYIDSSFMDDSFTLTAGRQLNKAIKELDELIAETSAEGLDVINLTTKRTRIYDLKSNLSKIIDKLLSSLTLEIDEQSWSVSIEKIIKAIKS